MRKRLRLTGRGRGMLVGGAVLVTTGIVLDSQAVIAAGIFALVLLSLCVAWVVLRTARTTLQRTPTPATLGHGEHFSAGALVRGPAGGGFGLITGLLPDWASSAATEGALAVRLDRREARLMAGGKGMHRGIYRWPELRMELPDPLGAVHGRTSEASRGTTVVFPKLEPLGPARVPAIPGGVSEFDDAHVLARLALGDVGVNPIPRPFRAGDNLRRMHWPATARAGEPMVRAEDTGPTRRAIVLLDTGRSAYRTREGFERAVSATASIAVRLLQLGWAVSVRLPGGESATSAVWAEGRSGELAVLAGLAGAAEGDGLAVGRLPDDPVDAAFAVTGGATMSRWFLPPMTMIRSETPSPALSGDGSLVWNVGRPLAEVWNAGASRLVPR